MYQHQNRFRHLSCIEFPSPLLVIVINRFHPSFLRRRVCLRVLRMRLRLRLPSSFAVMTVIVIVVVVAPFLSSVTDLSPRRLFVFLHRHRLMPYSIRQLGISSHPQSPENFMCGLSR